MPVLQDMLEVLKVPLVTSHHPLMKGVLSCLDVLKQGKHMMSKLGLLCVSLCITSCLLSCYPLYLNSLSLLLGDHLLENSCQSRVCRWRHYRCSARTTGLMVMGMSVGSP